MEFVRSAAWPRVGPARLCEHGPVLPSSLAGCKSLGRVMGSLSSHGTAAASGRPACRWHQSQHRIQPGTRRGAGVMPGTGRSRANAPERQLAARRQPIRFSSPRPEGWSSRNCRLRVNCSSSDEPPSSQESSSQILELPCLPFNPAEVLVPASSKTLHLYEARYLALLEEAMNRTQGLFAHIVVEPMRSEDGAGFSFVSSFCCLSHIEGVRRLEIGALVSVRGLCRMKLLGFTQMEPFLKGTLMILGDAPPDSPDKEAKITGELEKLKDAVRDVQRLQIKLKSPGDEPLLTPLEGAVQWAERATSGKLPVLSVSTSKVAASYAAPGASSPWTESSTPSSSTVAAIASLPLEEFLPSRAELVAFASLQPISGASPAELHKLLQARILSMETLETSKRIEICLDYAEKSRAGLAAKLALQNLSL